MRRFLPALALFSAIVATAPAIGQVRDLLFRALPRTAVVLLAGIFAVLTVAVFLYAIRRIYRERTNRGLRFAGLGAVLVLLALQAVGFATELASVNVAEKVHVLEYGLLAFLLYRAFARGERGDPALFVLVLATVTTAGVLEEWVQWLAPSRIGEIRDVAINAASGLNGLLFGLILEPPPTWSWRCATRSRQRAARGLAFAVLALGLFFGCAHLAYEIDDPEIGRFRSRWSAEELREIAARRRHDWALEPPTKLPVWGVEDYFLTEAGWHLQHRNHAYGEGWFYLAWQANRILEKYYAPFLDLEAYRGSGRRRYGMPARRELAAKKGRHDPSRYLSTVLIDRLYPWPKAPYYAALTAAVILLWTAPAWFPGLTPSPRG